MPGKKFIEFIEAHIAQEKSRNPKYSMRLLADSLSINPGIMSSILAGKRKLTRATAEEILMKMNVSRAEIMVILASISEEGVIVRNLTEVESDPIDAFGLTLIQILNIRKTPVSIDDLAKILGRDRKEILPSIDHLVSIHVFSQDGDMIASDKPYELRLHRSPEALHASVQDVVSLIQQSAKTAVEVKNSFPVQFTIRSNDAHIRYNIRHYWNAVESMVENLENSEGPEVYFGFTYLMKMTNSELK